MGTFSFDIPDWHTDPNPMIYQLCEKEQNVGFLAAHAYGMARALADQLGCDRGSVSGGILPNPDGTDSVVITIGMHTGASELSYRDRVMSYLRAGAQNDVREQQSAGLSHTDFVVGAGRRNAADHPGAVPLVSGTPGASQPDPGPARRMGTGGDAAGSEIIPHNLDEPAPRAPGGEPPPPESETTRRMMELEEDDDQ